MATSEVESIIDCFENADTTKINYGVYIDMIRSWLGLPIADNQSINDVVLHPIVLTVDELWEKPQEFFEDGRFSNASSECLAIGYLGFGSIDGIRCVLEQNASPIAIWVNRNDLPRINDGKAKSI